MPINPLNHHYAFENPASIYDEEAMTALELAGRTTAKVNETVKAYNELEKGTNEHLAQQDQRITKMNNVTMPAKVTEEVVRKINSGEFADEIDRYAGNLEARVDNLLGQVHEGSTSGDAELIDARTDFQGNLALNAGNAIRQVTTILDNRLDGISDYAGELVEAESTNGYYTETGRFYEDTNYYSISVEVNPGEVYLPYCVYGYVIPDALVLDADKKFIRCFHTSPGKMAENKFAKPVMIPDSAKYLVINSSVDFGAQVKKVTHAVLKLDSAVDYINNVAQAFRGKNPVTGENGLTITEGLVIKKDGTVTAVTSGATAYKVGEMAVNPGEVYVISGCSNFENVSWVLLDENGTFMDGSDTTTDTSTVVTVTKELIIPPKGGKLLVAGIDGTTPPTARRVLYTTENASDWSHLRWVCMGDSLTEVNSRTTQHYYDYISQKTGIQVVNMGMSGTGYKRGEENDASFLSRISDVPANADVVTIFGSGNDLSLTLGTPTDTDVDTVCGCINQTIDNFFILYPFKKLAIVSPTPWQNNEPSDEGSMSRYANALGEICKRRGIPFLDLFRCSGLRPNSSVFRAGAYSKDDGNGVHPDETGHKMIASQFYAFLQSIIGTY